MAPRRPPRRYRPITSATVAGALSLVLPTACLARLAFHSGSYWPLVYTGIMSTVTFLLYGYDKMQARNMEWRVTEVTLHTLELCGGWPGALLGQHFFQHKTRKHTFQIFFWAIVLGWQYIWWAIWSQDIQVQ
ncbi:DUF1294-domain-containing protein [Polyplosphaeria fusca]|uniref:DUF1294-domain-containing protein n=1 Tax=Polyplosphaeria fusca TaxID=682080 RepID=A0A9P4QKP9_9PLEO|nr:DUF1294-domain-containing protein [Polyplosphaeria fusca]